MLHPDLKDVLEYVQKHNQVKIYAIKDQTPWPQVSQTAMIFKDDIGCELGGPYGSAMLHCMYDAVVDGRVMVIGSDTLHGHSVWGRLTLLNAAIDDEESYYSFLQQVTLVPVQHSMEGVMIRIQPSLYKEWIRIHKDYVKTHTMIQFFSRLYTWYKQLSWIRGVEFVAITSNSDDIAKLLPLIEKHKSIIKAFEKRLVEDIKNCDTCDNNTVCTTINSLFKKG
ncbi:MAG: hypothetical protein AB1444_13155 [Spirochaetota bacterium]